MNRRGLGLLVVAAVLACGHDSAGGGRRTRGEVALAPDVVVVFADSMKKVPFDTRDVRLKRASEQLAAVAGHRVEFHVDRAVMPQYEASFQDMLIGTVEAVATDLQRLADHDAYADMTAALGQIAIVYDATVDERWGWAHELDLDTRTLTVRVGGVRPSFVPPGMVWNALVDALPELTRRRYAGKRPGDVDPAEYGRYLYYLDVSDNGPYQDTTATAKDLDAHADLQWLALAQELYGRVEQPKLRVQVGAWVLEKGATLFYTHLTQVPDAVSGVGANGPYARGRDQWARWVTEHLWELDESERHRLLQHAFPREPEAYPPVRGLEPARLGFAIADRWAAEGHEGPSVNRSPGTTYNEVVCPVDLVSEERYPFPNRCSEIFYRNVWRDEASKRQFVAALLQRDDEALYRAATAAIAEVGGAAAVLDLWRRVEKHDTAWRAIGREVGVLNLGEPLLDALQAMWRKQPQRRGTLLFILALYARQGYTLEKFWPNFRVDFGTVDAATFRDFLEHGPRAMATAWVVWPALATFDRGTPFAEHLDTLLDAQGVEDWRGGYKAPVDAIAAVIENMCQGGGRGELARLNAALGARVLRHPDEAKALARVQRLTGC